MPTSFPRLSICIIAASLLVPAIARPAAPPAPPAAPAAKKPQRSFDELNQPFPDRPSSWEDSVNNTYRGTCLRHDIEVHWEQAVRDQPPTNDKGAHYGFSLNALSVAIDGEALDSVSSKKLSRFLDNVAGKLSVQTKYKIHSYFINSVSSLCWHDDRGIVLYFYFFSAPYRRVFGAADVSLPSLRAELTEGEGPDPLDGKPPLPPLDADGHRPKIRYPWGGWRDADLPK